LEIKITHGDITICYDGILSFERNGKKVSGLPENIFEHLSTLKSEEQIIEAEYTKLHNRIFKHRNVDNLPISPDLILEQAGKKRTHKAFKGMLVAYHLRGEEGFWNFVKARYGVQKELFVAFIKPKGIKVEKTYPIMIDIPKGRRSATVCASILEQLTMTVSEQQLKWNIIDIQRNKLRKWRKDGEVNIALFIGTATSREIHEVLNYK